MSTKGTIKDVWSVHERRKERIRLMQREWARRNRDKVNAYRAATKERRRSVVTMTTTVAAVKNNHVVVKSRYHADWKSTLYHCPELTYRGKSDA